MNVIFYRYKVWLRPWKEQLFLKLYSLHTGWMFYRTAFVHVELQVDWGDHTMTYGINQRASKMKNGKILYSTKMGQNGKIHYFKDKKFSNPEHMDPITIQFNVPVKDIKNMVEFLEDCIKYDDGFDESFYYRFLPFGACIPDDPDSWYCSKLTARALQRCNVLDHSYDANMSPQGLFNVLQYKGVVVKNPMNIKPLYLDE